MSWLAGASLDLARRRRELDELAAGAIVDLLVVGGGITGAGVALDAASRGLRTVLVERRDLAHGTSRWSSKMAHGGLRYLASGDVRLALQSARERGVLMAHTAPHLVRPLPMVVPLTRRVSRLAEAALWAGVLGGDSLRVAARTGAGALPGPSRLDAAQTLRCLPGLRSEGLRGGIRYWEGQLEDDARLVVAVARTAAALGARVLTRVAAEAVGEDGADLADVLTGQRLRLRARAVVNATGVWASHLDPGVRLRPSRGSHVVLRSTALGGLRTAVTFPVPGQRNRFVFALPQRGGRVLVGITDDPDDRGLDAPAPTAADIAFLVETIAGPFAAPLTAADVVGAFAGLRPLVSGAAGRTADLSRRHALHVGGGGVVTVVGGKLTTYRAMAAGAVDLAVRTRGLGAPPSRTDRLALIGAAPPTALAAVAAPAALVARFGTEAPRVLAEAGGDPRMLAPVVPGSDVIGAELAFSLRHEGALDVDDLLERRTRLALVAADAEAARPLAEELVADLVETAVLAVPA